MNSKVLVSCFLNCSNCSLLAQKWQGRSFGSNGMIPKRVYRIFLFYQIRSILYRKYPYLELFPSEHFLWVVPYLFLLWTIASISHSNTVWKGRWRIKTVFPFSSLELKINKLLLLRFSHQYYNHQYHYKIELSFPSNRNLTKTKTSLRKQCQCWYCEKYPTQFLYMVKCLCV